MSLRDDLGTAARALAEALGASGRPPGDLRQMLRLVEAATGLASGDASALDVKIAAAALTEMQEAFEMFAPYRDVRKVTVFGSARIAAGSQIYSLTVEAARLIAEQGFMVVTGAGPGLMEAGMVGAGRDRSIGVSIRLPFEASSNSIIEGDDKHVTMRYFFTRKLMLMKESHGFVCLPGGFGTLDETFELLTLVQTGRSVPAPIVFLDPPDKPFWKPIMAALMPTLLAHEVISREDTGLYRITSDVSEAARIVTGFYSNFHSIRHVDGNLVLRMQRGIPERDVEMLSKGFSHIHGGLFRLSGPTDAETRDGDNLLLARLLIDYSGKGYAPLLPLIDSINRF